MKTYILGLDIGGTKINATVFDEDTMKAVYEKITPNKGLILDEVVTLITKLKKDWPLKAVGISSAGRIDDIKGNVIYVSDNLKGWKGQSVKSYIEKLFRIPCLLENDGNCAAWGEYQKDNLPDNFYYIALGTGIGAGLVSEGKLFVGKNFATGELGHTVLYPDGHPCHCGKKGCLERYISGRALEEQIKDKYQIEVVNKEDVYRELENSTSTIRNQFIKNFSIALINIQNTLDPELIVIGGGLGMTNILWKEELEELLKETSNLPILLKYSTFENRAAVFGAALLARKYKELKHGL